MYLQHELRKRIGFVPQKGLLFSGTIESNIKYGNPKMSRQTDERSCRNSTGNRIYRSKARKI